MARARTQEGMTRRFEPLSGAIASVAIDEDGFASVSLTHSACGVSTEHASSPLDTMDADIECSGCGEMLMRSTGEDGEAATDASQL